MNPPPIFLAGPTASGKTAVSLLLAEKLGGQIISVDSMQVYQGLDIGTAKPSLAERARVPHHLVDVVSLSDSFDAAAFVREAKAALGQVERAGERPIYCGGTGLYFKALAAGLGTAPPRSATLRAELETLPLEALLAELEQSDPETWHTIDRQNPRRVIRAVEAIRLSGRKFSEQRSDWTQPANGLWIGLERDRADLRTRIGTRVDAMFAAGLVAETQRLLQQGLRENPTALQALGYRQVVEHLDGLRSLSETIELVKIKTRQFAKRQMTWFKRQLQLTWLKVEPDESPELTAMRIAELDRAACQTSISSRQ